MSDLSPTLSPPKSGLHYPPFPELLPQGELSEGRYTVSFARSAEELDAVQKLRFEVFNVELGEGLAASYHTGRDHDDFDLGCHHLMVRVTATGEVVGTYRLQSNEMADAHRGFYSNTLFDLSGFPPEVRADAIELGRACVGLEHRNTQVLFLLWKGLALYVSSLGKRYFFGCSSLTSQDPVEGRAVLHHLATHGHVHPHVRVVPQPGFECYDGDPAPDLGFAVKIPKLFRIYLRHGALVCGPPAIDREFGTVDYLVLFDVTALSEKQVRTFFG